VLRAGNDELVPSNHAEEIAVVASVGNNMLSLTKQEVGTNGQGFHKWQAVVKGTENGNFW
jgi:hypothetical protein